MIAWLRLETEPPLEFHRQTGAGISADLTFRRLAGIGPMRRPLSVDGQAENANVTVTLDNGDGRLTEYFRLPPLRRIGRLLTAEGELFSGTVADCRLGAQIELTLEAGGTLPLSDRLPLRETTIWGSYKDKRTLPIVYGHTVVDPIPYDNSGQVFVLADHACQGVDRITRDDIAIDAFAFYNDTDDTGHAIAMLELAEPLAQGERLRAEVRGKQHPAHGGLLVNPAEILWDFLANVIGLPVSLSDLDQFRAETASAGIEIGGIIDDPSRTIRGQIDDICRSIGAVWSGGMPGIARLYPAADSGETAWGAFTVFNCQDMQCETSQSGLVTVLRVLHDYADGQPRRVVQLEAPEAIASYGRIERELDARWLRSPRLAADLGQRLLAYQARPVWRTTWRADIRHQTPPGVYVDLAHARAPVHGRMLVMDAELDPSTVSVTFTSEAAAGPAPRIEMTRLSTAFEPEVTSGANVAYSNGIATFTIIDDNGRPMVAAKVTLDGTETRLTDHQGRVQFSAPRGLHLLYVEANGYTPMEIEVTI